MTKLYSHIRLSAESNSVSYKHSEPCSPTLDSLLLYIRSCCTQHVKLNYRLCILCSCSLTLMWNLVYPTISCLISTELYNTGQFSSVSCFIGLCIQERQHNSVRIVTLKKLCYSHCLRYCKKKLLYINMIFPPVFKSLRNK